MARVQARHNELEASGSSESDGEAGGCCGHNTDEAPKEGPISAQPAYIRVDFIRKVYSILTVQLLLTCGISGFMMIAVPRSWLVSHMGIYQAALFSSLALILGMSCCCREAARRFPTNYLLLFAFTAMEGVVVGFVISMYSVQSVFLAFGTTCLVFLSLTAYACFTKSDFTGMGPYLAAALMVMIGFSGVLWLYSLFAPVPPVIHTIFSALGALLFSFYIIYDTQLIVGGKGQQFDVDDYCSAALALYLDILNLFLYLLSLFGDRS